VDTKTRRGEEWVGLAHNRDPCQKLDMLSRSLLNKCGVVPLSSRKLPLNISEERGAKKEAKRTQ